MRTPRDKETQDAMSIEDLLLLKLEALNPPSFTPGWVKSHASIAWSRIPRIPSKEKEGKNDLDWSFVSKLPAEWAKKFSFTKTKARLRRAAKGRIKYKTLTSVIAAVAQAARESEDNISPNWIKKTLPTAFDTIRKNPKLRTEDGKIAWEMFHKLLPKDIKGRWQQGFDEKTRLEVNKKKQKHTPETMGEVLTKLIELHDPKEIGLRFIQQYDQRCASGIIRLATLRRPWGTTVDWPSILEHVPPRFYHLLPKAACKKVIEIYSSDIVQSNPEEPFSVETIQASSPRFARWIQITFANNWDAFEKLLPTHLHVLWEPPGSLPEDKKVWMPTYWYQDRPTINNTLVREGFADLMSFKRDANEDQLRTFMQFLCSESCKGNDKAGTILLDLIAREMDRVAPDKIKYTFDPSKNPADRQKLLELIYIRSREGSFLDHVKNFFMTL